MSLPCTAVKNDHNQSIKCLNYSNTPKCLVPLPDTVPHIHHWPRKNWFAFCHSRVNFFGPLELQQNKIIQFSLNSILFHWPQCLWHLSRLSCTSRVHPSFFLSKIPFYVYVKIYLSIYWQTDAVVVFTFWLF